MGITDFALYHYRGTVLRVVDGDTIRVRFSLGLNIYHDANIRIAGINAPELIGVNRPAALEATSFLGQLVSRQTVYLRTHKDGKSFDRFVADCFVEGEAGALIDVAEAMVAAGHAVRVLRAEKV